MLRQRVLSVACLSLLVACTGGDAIDYDPDWGSVDLVDEGKFDGLMDAIEDLDFGAVGNGFVGGEQLDLYRMNLRQGDRFTLELSVLSGDLNPHIALYYGLSTYIQQDNWTMGGSSLIKWYTAPHTGEYVIAVSAFRAEGEGNYRLTASCEGGPCHGEYVEPTETLELDAVNSCIQQARRCAFARLPEYGGRVGETRASQIWSQCLAQASTGDGEACISACTADTDEGAPALCQELTSSLIFYADQSAACLTLLDDCMGSCYDAGGDMSFGDGEFWELPESMCWTNGFNGTCDSYARGNEACGGQNVTDSYCDCYDSCESTSGVWMDDLDTICSEECEWASEAIEEQCSETCEGDPECINLCTYETMDQCW